MITDVKLVHYLNENTYKQVCEKLKLSTAHSLTSGNFVRIENKKIYYIELYNILYKQFGHIWFMSVHVDFPKFDCEYDEFEKSLYKAYHKILGEKIMANFPLYNEATCDHIEYSDLLTVENADEKLASLQKGKCLPEQLNRTLWSEYKKPNGTLKLFLNKQDDTHIDVLASCHGTALKKRIKSEFHNTVGIKPSKAVNADTEQEIMAWLYRNYKVI
jgi:hypothetical protein